MSGDVRGDMPQGSADDPFAQRNQPISESEQGSSWHWELTLQIDNGLPQLSDLATIFSAVVRVYVKLSLLTSHFPNGVLQYAALPLAPASQSRSPTVLSITMNSPLTLVLSVSESVGKALASLIDAVSQSRLRYDKVKLEVQREKVALARGDAEWEVERALSEFAVRKQFDEHRMAMLERVLDLQLRAQTLRTQERKAKNDEVAAQLEMSRYINDVCLQQIAQLQPNTSEDMKHVLAETFMQDLNELVEYGATLTVESMKPRKSV